MLHVHVEVKRMKYLVINIARTVSELHENNFSVLTNNVKEDLRGETVYILR